MISVKTWLAAVLSSCLATGVPAFAGAAGKDWEFGRYHIGQSFEDLPSQVRHRDCDDARDVFSCEVLLDDGVWYVFEHRKVVEKTIYLPARNLLAWIDPRDSARECKARLERLTGKPFKIWTDDYGVVFVETRDLIRSPRGAHYNIIVTFKSGRMQDITQTTLAHPDV